MTPTPIHTTSGRRLPIAGTVRALAAMVVFATATPVFASDIPDKPFASRSGINGYYKVSANTDPFFGTVQSDREWFLDFGQGVLAGKTSGSVAISMRQNPNVKVRMYVWQLDPSSRTLTVGSQTGEGSRQAVALARWQVIPVSDGVMLTRGTYSISLRRADAAE